jgi:hypothetical protein
VRYKTWGLKYIPLSICGGEMRKFVELNTDWALLEDVSGEIKICKKSKDVFDNDVWQSYCILTIEEVLGDWYLPLARKLLSTVY